MILKGFSRGMPWDFWHHQGFWVHIFPCSGHENVKHGPFACSSAQRPAKTALSLILNTTRSSLSRSCHLAAANYCLWRMGTSHSMSRTSHSHSHLYRTRNSYCSLLGFYQAEPDFQLKYGPGQVMSSVDFEGNFYFNFSFSLISIQFRLKIFKSLWPGYWGPDVSWGS